MASKIYTGITSDLAVRFFIADTTDLVKRAAELHQTTPVSTAAFGRTLTGATILGRMLKNDTDKLTLQVQGSAEIKSILVVADSKGNVKGYISAPDVILPPRADGKLDVGGAVGKDGHMLVIKDYGLKEPFIGKTPLVSGEIAEDLASYFMHSEQQPSIVSLGVSMDPEVGIKHAGGIIIQPLPFAEDEVIDRLEALVAQMPSMTEALAQGDDIAGLTARLLPGFEVEITDEAEIDFLCDCNKEKFERGMITLPKEDLIEILEEDGKADVQCHFCNEIYHFDATDIQAMIDQK